MHEKNRRGETDHNEGRKKIIEEGRKEGKKCGQGKGRMGGRKEGRK